MDFDVFSFFAIVLIGSVFIYFGYWTRVTAGTVTADTIRLVPPAKAAPALFVVLGAGELALAVTLILDFGLGGASFLLGLAVAMFLIAFAMA